MEQRRRSHLFVLRLWEEELGEGVVEWRGQVESVSSGQVQYFRDWNSLAAILPAMLGATGSNPRGSAALPNGER